MGLRNSKLCGLRHRVLRCKSIKALKQILSSDGEEFNIDRSIFIDGYENVTPLWLAARYDDIDVIRILIEAGADVNLPCCGLRMTPLHIAANNHNVLMVEMLLKAGADPNILDRWNYSPLMYVAIHHEPFVVNQLFQVFLDYGCDINFGACLDSEGEFEHMDINVDLMELCSSYQGDYITYVREPSGPISGTALHLAIQNPHLPTESVDILLTAGAIMDKPNLYGQTPLMGAIMDVYYDYHKYVKNHAETLVDYGSKVGQQDKRGWTALHYAAQRGSVDCMNLLLRAGADCNVLSNKHESPLWILLGLGWREAAMVLVSNGCQINRPLLSTTILQINQNMDVCRFGPILPIEFLLCNRDYALAELFVRAGCEISGDTWLGHHSDPPEPKLVQFLEKLNQYLLQRQQVRSLKVCCRDSVRAFLQQGIAVKLDQITLPQMLKDFICLGEDFI